MTDLLGTLDISGWDLLIAAIAVGAAFVLAHFAKRGMRSLLARIPSLSPGVVLLVERVTWYAIVLLGVGIAFGFLGAAIQPLLAMAIIVGVVLALVLRGIADNFAAGVVLQSRHPLAVGDEIAVGDFVGVVLELNGRAVIIRTVDGRTVHVPNAQVLADPLVNNSTHGSRRSEIEVRLGGADASGEADLREAVVMAASEAQGVHRKEGVHLRPITIGADRRVYRVRYWHHPLHGVPVTDAVVDAVAALLKARDLDGVVTSDIPPAPLTPPLGF
ncbi:mechanosensitive ion channel family protein [Agromyces italicus]|uniref:mechanosensitive ion channel family protein n=1 Tax=Agromyces italicus TaxID=279572 RepID=UPI0003B5191C|nr:mechanosensitive ion channel domain-containing protein [Agromyces italicus]